MDSSHSSLRQDHRHTRHRRENPSFSSTLLDAIYRSIDAGEDDAEEDRYSERSELVFYRETMRKKQSASLSVSSSSGLREEEKMANFRRACMIEKWMEKKVSEKVVVCRSSAADFDGKVSRRGGAVVLMNSSSSSSESSSGGGFSSSESESLRRPKPIRTSVSAPPSEKSQFSGGYSRHHHHHHQSAPNAKPKGKHENLNSFVKTKYKALKIYGDLKKVKQPISPGGRLASFLNSLFTNASHRKSSKAKPASASSAATTATACSTASSFSRSCLSNASTKFSDASSAKRSVRFCPVSVIVGEDCRPCGHKTLLDEDLTDRRRVQEVAIDLLKSYQKKSRNDVVSPVVQDFDMRDVVDVVRMRNDTNSYGNDIEEDEDEDDAASYSSSDLFELDNLSAIGIERYHEELPVYETTHFDTNRAIANGLIL